MADITERIVVWDIKSQYINKLPEERDKAEISKLFGVIHKRIGCYIGNSSTY